MAFVNDVRFKVDKRALLARLKAILPAQSILSDEEELGEHRTKPRIVRTGRLGPRGGL